MINESQIVEQLQSGIEFPLLRIRVSRMSAKAEDQGIDAILEVRCESQAFRFATKVSTRSTPRAFEGALFRIKKSVEALKRESYRPMIVVPYLREAQLDELQQNQVSGIDLSGNGVVAIPERLLVYRTGQPNKFPDSTPSKFAYRGTTSLVARAFLCRNSFDSLADIEQEIRSRGADIALSTISKALKRLESDLIVDRSRDTIRLRQPEKLLEKLAESYKEPEINKRLTCSIDVPIEKLFSLLPEQSKSVLTGRSSIDAYAVMGRSEWPVLYTTRIDALMEGWGDRIKETSRFIDLELRQNNDVTVYFDARMKNDVAYASPIQVYLELTAGDKREREIAMQVKEAILKQLNE